MNDIEDFALKSCHPLYREWCQEDKNETEDELTRADFERELREGR